jgi:hypothetical protein
MHLVAAFAVNDHASAEKADAGNDALNDAARRCELVTACSSFKSRDNEPGGAESDKPKGSDTNVSMMREAVESDQASNQRCYKQPGKDN